MDPASSSLPAPSFPADPLPSTTPPTSELASWVHQVRQRTHSITSNHSTSSSYYPAPSSSPVRSQLANAPLSSASDLEQDFQRQRQERQRRRNRLSSSGIRGITDSPLSSPVSELPPTSPSRSFVSVHTTMAGAGPPPSRTEHASPSIGASGPAIPKVRRANSLLERYGGQYGPTGVAAGPKTSDAPVSLANFMGGRASGPRLTKPVGDGKSTPPEAAEIHESRWNALPGLASGTGGARPLASFLEERAGKRMSVPVLPKDACSSGSADASTSSTSPAKYTSYLSRSRSNSYRTDRDVTTAPPSPSVGLATSPRKAYMDLIERQNAENASLVPRPPSPVKPWERSPVMASPDEFPRPRSPFKAASGYAPSSPAKASFATPIPALAAGANRWAPSGESSYTSPRKDATTSPLKAEDVPLAKTLTASPALGANRAAPSWKSSTLPVAKGGASNPASPVVQDSQRSASFSSAPLAHSATHPSLQNAAGADRNPTASLTRLSAKKMVGQRIREARERDVQAQKESEASTVSGVTSGLSRYGGSALGGGGVRDRWPASASGGSNVSTPTFEEKKVGPWSPSKFGNALPGMAGRSPPKASSAASGYGTSPSKRIADDEVDIRPSPVRLPGMGAETSPFKRFSAAATSPTKEEVIGHAKQDDVLQPLTKGRVRGPTRRAAASTTTTTAKPSLQIGTASSQSAAGTGGTSFAAPSSPRKLASGFSTPTSPSKTQALASKFEATSAAAIPSSPTKGSFAVTAAPRSPVKASFGSTTAAVPSPSSSAQSASLVDKKATEPAAAPPPTKPPRSTRGKRIHVLISGSGSNLQSLIDATLINPPPGIPVIPNAQISFVLSNRKAAYGLTRASESNPPIPTKVLALKTWQNRNPSGTREEYDRVLARAVLDGPEPEGKGTPPDLIVLAGFMHIVSEGFLHALGHKTSLPESTLTIGARPSKAVPIINLHPALPGAFDGANAIPRAFEAYQQGLVDRTGCMVHEVVADVDRGRPLIVREVVIRPSWDLAKLEEEIHKVEHVIIVEGARQVLEGRLEQLDREQEAKENELARQQQQQQQQQQKRSPSPLKAITRSGKGPSIAAPARPSEDGAIVAFKAEQALKASSVDAGAILAYKGSSSSRQAKGGVKPKTVSIEVISIRPDGTTKTIEHTPSAPGGISEKQLCYNDETLAIVHRYKAASGLMENRVWIRLGLRSPIHPLQQELSADVGSEVMRRAEELAKRYGVQPTFVPAGFEDVDLIDSLGGRWAVSRQGSRARFEGNGTGLYSVRSAIAAGSDAGQMTITQVDLVSCTPTGPGIREERGGTRAKRKSDR
ncbi:Bifunctional purine biosynthetic protein ADE5,7 [Thecaphora frezii]